MLCEVSMIRCEECTKEGWIETTFILAHRKRVCRSMNRLLHATVTISRDFSFKTQLNRHLRYSDRDWKHNGVWRLWGLGRLNSEIENVSSCLKTICLFEVYQAAINLASIRKRSLSLERIEVATGELLAGYTGVKRE